MLAIAAPAAAQTPRVLLAVAENLWLTYYEEALLGIFSDGFESGDLGAWSSTSP